jgi:hypothetical protein
MRGSANVVHKVRYGTCTREGCGRGGEVGINSELYSRHTCTFHQSAYRCLDVVVSQHSCMAVCAIDA